MKNTHQQNLPAAAHKTRFLTHRLSVLAITAVFAVVIGCSTTQQTENLLSAAGFKAMPATTPQQQAHLKTLPTGKVTLVVRDGQTSYVYPDVPHQILYVGQDAQYQEYQRLRLQHQMVQDQVQAAEMNTEPGWGVWGGFGGPVVVPAFRR
jgi:hypothetical protein